MELSKVIDEIKRIPEDRLSEVYDWIHSFRLGIEPTTTQDETNNIMQFSGCWQDMPTEQFDEFLDDIDSRRQQAFAGRLDRETVLD